MVRCAARQHTLLAGYWRGKLLFFAIAYCTWLAQLFVVDCLPARTNQGKTAPSAVKGRFSVVQRILNTKQQL
ncbi:MAG: hypothetical protein QNJ51_06870 [Calothrix sp. MO_167.B12]|nr:hypothetical protein [Calothrix sp. MO_167.B12]